jgi:RNA polymerase sigma factor (sigma-70 family)
VERQAQARLGGLSSLHKQDLTQITFLRVWNWLRGTAGIPPKPAIMLHKCLGWAYPDLMRDLYGREPAKGAAESDVTGEFEENAGELSDQGAVSRIPLSLEAVAKSEGGNIPSLLERLSKTQGIESEVESTLVLWELRQKVRRAIAKLPPNYRACILCRYLEQLSVRETAQKLGMTAPMVEHNTARAIALLKLDPELGQE